MGARIGLEHARRYVHLGARGRVGGAVGGRGQPECSGEARGERPDTVQSDGGADIQHSAIGVPQQRRGPLQAAGQKVPMRGEAEGPVELAAEVCGRQARGPGECRDVEWLAVAGVDEVLRPQ